MPRRTTLVSSHGTHSQRGNHHLRRAVYHSLPRPQLTTPCLMTFPSPGEGLCACSRRLGSCARLLTHGVCVSWGRYDGVQASHALLGPICAFLGIQQPAVSSSGVDVRSLC